MIHVNLLPRRYVATRRPGVRTRALPWALATVVALVAVGGFYLWQYEQLQGLQQRLAAEQAQVQQVDAQLERAARIGTGEKGAEAQAARLHELKGRPWSPLLLELRELTPTGLTWLHLAVDSEGVTISGRAEHMSDLAHFLAALIGSPAVRQADLHYAREEQIGSGSLQELAFEIGVRLTPLRGGNISGA